MGGTMAMETTHQHETVYRYRATAHDSLTDWIDKAAHATASRWCGGHCVVASIGHFHLDRPIRVGELVDVHATLVYTGCCSMHILVTVYSSGQTAQCPVIFVAVDDTGSPVEVPKWVPVTMLDLQRQRQARVRIGMRKRIEDAMTALNHSVAGGTTLRFGTGDCDVDPNGRVRAGRVMQWIDESARACGADWTGAEAITAYVTGIRFWRAIGPGDTVNVNARVIHTGPRSVHTSIYVTTSRCPDPVALGALVVVALDERGQARRVPAWQPRSAEDRRFDELARHLIELRQSNEPFTTAVA
ncbi:acyl-CoA thioesterase [Mycobacterium sp. NPDC048908]|uniref:acyl-CoA thioesterase n=1 Tax=Mycobacterium sp. NPDC048908 TaxID=3364292 RepID=UPI00371227B3